MNHTNGELIPGVGKNSRTVEGGDGTKQAALPYAFHYLDPQALFAMARVMAEGGEKYGRPEDNWRKIDLEDHLNHMLSHAFAYLAGDRSDDHLEHMACRAMGALQVYLMAKNDVQEKPYTRAGEDGPLNSRIRDAASRGIVVHNVVPSCRVCRQPMKISESFERGSTEKIYYCYGHGLMIIPLDVNGNDSGLPTWRGNEA